MCVCVWAQQRKPTECNLNIILPHMWDCFCKVTVSISLRLIKNAVGGKIIRGKKNLSRCRRCKCQSCWKKFRSNLSRWSAEVRDWNQVFHFILRPRGLYTAERLVFVSVKKIWELRKGQEPHGTWFIVIWLHSWDLPSVSSDGQIHHNTVNTWYWYDRKLRILLPTHPLTRTSAEVKGGSWGRTNQTQPVEL